MGLGENEDEASVGVESALSAGARARMERQRLRARALRDARLVLHPPPDTPALATHLPARALDSGGGFLVESEAGAEGPRAAPAPPAPAPHPRDWPHCAECGAQFAASYLWDTFDYSVCDACREAEGAHALVTRTEAKSEFLLQDCDLDARPPPLRCLRRRNPHRAAAHDMRLYLRAQLVERARLVWGSLEALEEERTRRAARRTRAHHTHARRRLRDLRLAARSSLVVAAGGAHQHRHRWAAEQHDAARDQYSRHCLDCGHTETYEKM